jgi:hypothetical protein
MPVPYAARPGVQSSALPREGEQRQWQKTYLVGITLLGCLALSIKVRAQGGDVESQIKPLQQEATKSEMNNDVSWAQQHLAEGFVAWGQWRTKDEFIKGLQHKSAKGRTASNRI